jgi:hypothetical protein
MPEKPLSYTPRSCHACLGAAERQRLFAIVDMPRTDRSFAADP